MCLWVVYISKSWLVQAVASLALWISFDDMSPNCVVVSLRLGLFKSCETWHEDREIGVSRLKLWELLTCNSHPLLSSPLPSSHVHCFLPFPCCDLSPPLPNDVILPFTSLHTMSPCLSLVSQGIMGWRTQRDRGQIGSASSGCFVSFHLNPCLPSTIAPAFLSVSLPLSVLTLRYCSPFPSHRLQSE